MPSSGGHRLIVVGLTPSGHRRPILNGDLHDKSARPAVLLMCADLARLLFVGKMGVMGCKARRKHARSARQVQTNQHQTASQARESITMCPAESNGIVSRRESFVSGDWVFEKRQSIMTDASLKPQQQRAPHLGQSPSPQPSPAESAPSTTPQ